MITFASLWVGTLLYTSHLDNNYDYNEDNQLISLDYFYQDDKYLGVINFDNSFGDNTSGVYWGTRKHLYDTDITYGVRLGVTHGYHEYYPEYRMHGPITTSGHLTFVVSPSVGYMLTDSVETELILFGNAVGLGLKIGFR